MFTRRNNTKTFEVDAQIFKLIQNIYLYKVQHMMLRYLSSFKIYICIRYNTRLWAEKKQNVSSKTILTILN